MLTRYKQVYNGLTHSDAFVDGKPFNADKVNKKVFTPHNLKAVIFGANGFYAVHYTKNNSDRKLVEYHRFKLPYIDSLNGDTLPQKYQEFLKETLYSKNNKGNKGMIDALRDVNLAFNYVEEIIFFSGGFVSDKEKFFEIDKLNDFIDNLEEKSEMKRLCGVAIISAVLPENLKLSSKDFVINQLEKYTVVTHKKYNPERTELGLLIKPGLNPAKYGPDQKYEPDSDNSKKDNINCCLSRYFYEEEQAAIARKKKKEEEAKQAAIAKKKKKEEEARKKAEEEKAKQYDEMLIKAVDSTITKLEKFYGPCFGGKFSGIIHKDGVLFSKKNTVNNMNKLTQAIYKVWSTYTIPKNKEVAGVDILKLSSEKGYFPGFHFERLKSKEDWVKYKSDLRDWLLTEYSKYFEKEPSKITEIDRSVTNCLLIQSRGSNQWILRMTGIPVSQTEDFKRDFDETVGEVYLASASKGMIADMSTEGGILTLTYIVDYDAFLNEVLFAYKQYRAGLKPSLGNALVGMKMNGVPLTINLLDPRKMLITIIAGSRSGKGTMTMSLLATIFGSGGSVVYLDNKPDIGAMLWDLEREYSGQGLKLLSVDMSDKIQEFTGSTPIRSGPMNLIEEEEEQEDLFRTLRMVKLFQLVSFIGSNSRKIKETLGINTSNLFFISDEMTSTNIDYTKLCKHVAKQYTDYKKKADKAKATDKDKELAEYYNKLNDILDKTPDYLTKGFAKDFGQSGVKIIVVGQQLNTGWKVNETNFAKSFAGKLILNSHISFSGRLQATNKTFNFTKEQEDLADRTGVFEYADKIPAPLVDTLDYKEDKAERFTQFRSYFSIVKNDFDYNEYETKGLSEYLSDNPKRFTSQYLNNYKDKSYKVIDDAVKELYDFEKGCNKDEVSFSGLLKVMQEGTGMSDAQLIENMGNGYRLIDAVFKKMSLGNYSCVEEYLYDCSPSSLFTQLELEKRFDGIIGQKETVKDEESVFEWPTSDDAVMNSDDITVSNDKDTSKDINMGNSFNSENRPIPPKPQVHSNDEAPKRVLPSKPQINSNMGISFDTEDVPKRVIPEKPHTAPSNAYRGVLKISPNPFEQYDDAKAVGTLSITREVTEQINNDIDKVIGLPDSITDFKVTKDGVLVLNGVAYMPRFEPSFIESLPLGLRNKIESGALIDFFDMQKIYRYKNLNTFVIERESLAQGRARKEMGIGFRKRWSVLFKKFPYLGYIKVGSVEYVRDNPDTDAENKFLDLFQRNPQSTYATPSISSRMDQVWDSRPVRIITNAVGWTVGVQAVWMIAGLFGPWGLLFGAIAAANAYSTLKGGSPAKELEQKRNKESTNKSKKSKK